MRSPEVNSHVDFNKDKKSLVFPSIHKDVPVYLRVFIRHSFVNKKFLVKIYIPIIILYFSNVVGPTQRPEM